MCKLIKLFINNLFYWHSNYAWEYKCVVYCYHIMQFSRFRYNKINLLLTGKSRQHVRQHVLQHEHIDLYMSCHVMSCVCSSLTWNLCQLRIVQCKLGIPSLAGKLRIEHKLVQTLDSNFEQ